MKMTEKQVDIILKRYHEDVYMLDIAQEIGVSIATLKRWIQENRKQYGLEFRKGSTQRKLHKIDPDVAASSWNVSLGLRYIQSHWVSNEVCQ